MMGQRKAERPGKGWGAEGICLHKIFGTASKMQASWERGLRGSQITVKMSTGVSVQQDRAVSSAGTVGWDGTLPSQPHPSFTESPFIGTSWAGLGARNLGPDFSSAITKWTS